MNLTEKYISSGKINTTSKLVNTFKNRVLADGGTFEAEDFLKDWTLQNLDIYNRSEFLLTANGYKAGTLYSFKGQDYNTFTRAGNGTRINASFTEELIGTNIPRIDYEHGVPTFLRENQTSNLINNSAAPATQSITVVIGQIYTLSFFGTGTITVSGGLTATVVGTSNTVKTQTSFGRVTSTTTSVTLTISGTVTNCNFVNSTSWNEPTSHVPRVGSLTTRVVDTFAPLTLGTSMFDTPYLVYVEIISTDNSSNSNNGGIYNVQVDTNNQIVNRVDNLVLTRIGGVLTVMNPGGTPLRAYATRNRYLLYINPATGQHIKSVSSYDGTSWNGFTTTPATATLPSGLDKIEIGNVPTYLGTSIKVRQFAIIKDFTGISNIATYMQQLVTKTSI